MQNQSDKLRPKANNAINFHYVNHAIRYCKLDLELAHLPSLSCRQASGFSPTTFIMLLPNLKFNASSSNMSKK